MVVDLLPLLPLLLITEEKTGMALLVAPVVSVRKRSFGFFNSLGFMMLNTPEREEKRRRKNKEKKKKQRKKKKRRREYERKVKRLRREEREREREEKEKHTSWS